MNQPWTPMNTGIHMSPCSWTSLPPPPNTPSPLNCYRVPVWVLIPLMPPRKPKPGEGLCINSWVWWAGVEICSPSCHTRKSPGSVHLLQTNLEGLPLTSVSPCPPPKSLLSDFTQEVLEKAACQSASGFLFKFQKQHVRYHSPHFTGEETEAQGSGNVDKVWQPVSSRDWMGSLWSHQAAFGISDIW